MKFYITVVRLVLIVTYTLAHHNGWSALFANTVYYVV